MHGINDNHNEFNDMQSWIREIDPNVTMYSLPVGDDLASITNLWNQGQQIMDQMRERIAALPEVYKDGYVLLSHSQGALTARTVVERMDDHNIHTYIGLAGPQMGEYGIPKVGPHSEPLLQKLAKVGKELVFSVALTGPLRSEFQDKLSVANFWNDPRPRYGLFGKPHADYLNGNTFLPVLNNDPHRGSQGPGKAKNDTESERYKANFLRLQHAVFTAGTADDMIFPWNSGDETSLILNIFFLLIMDLIFELFPQPSWGFASILLCGLRDLNGWVLSRHASPFPSTVLFQTSFLAERDD